MLIPSLGLRVRLPLPPDRVFSPKPPTIFEFQIHTSYTAATRTRSHVLVFFRPPSLCVSLFRRLRRTGRRSTPSQQHSGLRPANTLDPGVMVAAWRLAILWGARTWFPSPVLSCFWPPVTPGSVSFHVSHFFLTAQQEFSLPVFCFITAVLVAFGWGWRCLLTSVAWARRSWAY